jgi:predicted unusual protein kinase regulating ubiquinone biosynthesis (AarF/ABC1/UbiB family)
MKTIDYIPTSKIERASKLVQTGAKIGVNYIKYYGGKMVNSELTRDKLDVDNAEDIYDGLSSLKGSALKVAQMLSMDKSFLPQAYVEKFSLSQFSVPPLSAPLVLKTFKTSEQIPMVERTDSVLSYSTPRPMLKTLLPPSMASTSAQDTSSLASSPMVITLDLMDQ